MLNRCLCEGSSAGHIKHAPVSTGPSMCKTPKTQLMPHLAGKHLPRIVGRIKIGDRTFELQNTTVMCALLDRQIMNIYCIMKM